MRTAGAAPVTAFIGAPNFQAGGYANDKITLWVGTNTDMHDQKRVEVLLKEEHQRKDQFLALLAHELRNPLAPLGNAVQILPLVQDDPVRTKDLIGIMQRQVKQMTRLIDDLLDLARITQGRILLRRERILVSAVVAAAIAQIHGTGHLFVSNGFGRSGCSCRLFEYQSRSAGGVSRFCLCLGFSGFKRRDASC